jgi:hypothetical protein
MFTALWCPPHHGAYCGNICLSIVLKISPQELTSLFTQIRACFSKLIYRNKSLIYQAYLQREELVLASLFTGRTACLPSSKNFFYEASVQRYDFVLPSLSKHILREISLFHQVLTSLITREKSSVYQVCL